MANYASIARPYALAAFEYARDQKQLADWLSFLKSAALIAKDKDVHRLLMNPAVSSYHLLELFEEVLAAHIDTSRHNFLRLLAQQQRLAMLPEIAELYNNSYAALEKVSTVKVVTAIEVSDDYRQKLAYALSKRIDRDVSLECEVDPSILGGAVIHIGDRVIDGSVRGKLTRLLEFSLR